MQANTLETYGISVHIVFCIVWLCIFDTGGMFCTLSPKIESMLQAYLFENHTMNKITLLHLNV